MQHTSTEDPTARVNQADVAEFREKLNRRVVADAAGDVNRALIAEFRATGGKVGGVFAGSPLLLLTTTGAKTGKPVTVPVLHTRDGDRYVIIASKAGAPVNPLWYENLLAHPRATVEIGNETFEVISTVAQSQERDRLFAHQAAQLPIYAEYQQKTSRRIPVVVLDRLP